MFHSDWNSDKRDVNFTGFRFEDDFVEGLTEEEVDKVNDYFQREYESDGCEADTIEDFFDNIKDYDSMFRAALTDERYEKWIKE
jgi:hypothetical protein